MALVAKHGSTLIFEQPELHLHPKIQARLADFFLSIVLSGKQCIIETHSEYLTNRLRYRAAIEDNDCLVTDKLKIYFVENHNGASVFKEIVVNEFGAITDWPDGFFDQTQIEAEAILRASLSKRRNKKGK
jgi:predicted ATPase